MILFLLIPYGILCGKIIIENSPHFSLIILAPLAILLLLLYSKISVLLYLLILVGPYDLPYPKFILAGATLGLINIIKSFGLDVFIFLKAIGTNWKKRHFSDGAARYYAAYLIISLLSILFSPSKSNGVKLWLALIHPFFVYIIISVVIQNKETIRNIASLFVLSGIFSVILATIQIILGSGLKVEDVLRLQAFGLSKNAYAAFLVIMVIFCYTLYIVGNRIRYLYYFMLFLIMLILTGTRSAMLALLITTLLLYWITKRKTKGMLIAFLLVLAVWNLPQSINRITTSHVGFFDTIDKAMKGESVDDYLNTGNLYGRTRFWDTGLDLFRSSPIIGNGLGAAAVVYEVAGNRKIISTQGDVTRIHSEWIRVLSDVGLIGFLTLFVSFYLFGKNAIHHYKHAKTDFTRSVSLAAFLSLIAYIIIGVTEVVSSFYYQMGVPVWLLLGYSNNLYHQEKNS